MLISLISSFAVAQPIQPDTIIERGIYRSFFSRVIQQPIAVTYTLYKGGGDASRDNDAFVVDHQVKTRSHRHYHESGYDRGHMAPAEDFAYNDSLQAITFRYYNCVHQHPRLNRGAWKSSEADVRTLSQLDTIVVVCYNTFTQGESIPQACYKAAYTYPDKRLLYMQGYENNRHARTVHVDTTIMQAMYHVIQY